MADKKKLIDYKLVKVDGYSSNGKYLYCKDYPQGNKISVAVNSSTKTDFIGYLSDIKDRRHAPVGSVIALQGVSNIKDNFFVSKWAQTVSKKPQSEEVIVSPATLSSVIALANNKTQVIARILDPVPLAVNDIDRLKDTCISAIKDNPQSNLSGKRGFLLRVGVIGQSNTHSATFAGINNLSAELLADRYFNPNGGSPTNALASVIAAAKKIADKPSSYIEVVGFTDSAVFNFNDSTNDEKLAKTPNFRIQKGKELVPTFSNAAFTIDTQDGNKIKKVIPLPGKNIKSDLHGLVGAHDKKNPISMPFSLPKELKALVTTQAEASYPVTISPYTDASNKKFNSIVVKVAANAPTTIHERVINALQTPPRKGADGYYFDKKERKKVESALSDLAGTPALFTTTGSLDAQKHVFVVGRTTDSYFKDKLNALSGKFNIKRLDGDIYAIPEAESIAALTAMSALLKEVATTPLSKNYMAQNAPVKTKVPSKNKKISYFDWLTNVYYQNAERIADEFDKEINDVATDAGINWGASKNNIRWPFLDGESVSIGQTANVKPLNTTDNGSCYISASFSSWRTKQGNPQHGIAVTFTNFKKDSKQRWTYTSHADTYAKYNDEVWGNNEAPVRKVLSAEEIAKEKAEKEARDKIKLAEKIANANALKIKAFNDFSASPMFDGQHQILDSKKLLDFPNLVQAREYTYKSDPNNKAFAFAAFDIHNRFVGYQYVLEEKVLANKKKNKWNNKFFNYGFQKDDAKTGLPLGTHRVIGQIKEDIPHDIYYSEGWGNAGAVHRLTDEASVLCFDKDNMKKVIGLMIKKYPNHTHIHVADNDAYSSKKGNVGVVAALDNAYNFGVGVVIPDVQSLPQFIQNKYTDSSDMYVYGDGNAYLSALTSPMNVSDIVDNYAIKIIYVADDKLEKQVTDLVIACRDDGIDDVDAITGFVNVSIASRNETYSKFQADYIPKIADNYTVDAIQKFLNDAPAKVNIQKLDYAILDNSQDVTQGIEAVNKPIDINQNQDVTAPTELPLWGVSVAPIDHPQKANATITEIIDKTGDNMEYIASTLDRLGAQYHCDKTRNRFLAPYKFINLINSSLSKLTGAPRFYAGRSKKNQGEVVIRGDFTIVENKEEIESVVKSLGIEYSAENLGYVVENPNTYIFIKEALSDGFEKTNPSVETIQTPKLTEQQEGIQSSLVQVSHSLGIERKKLAKQQLKLNQHNSKLGQLYSPIVAGLYVLAEEKVKDSEKVSRLSVAQRVYTQQRTLQTLIRTLDVSHPTLEYTYKKDLSVALQILAEQMPVVEVQTPKEDVVEVQTTKEDVVEVQTPKEDTSSVEISQESITNANDESIEVPFILEAPDLNLSTVDNKEVVDDITQQTLQLQIAAFQRPAEVELELSSGTEEAEIAKSLFSDVEEVEPLQTPHRADTDIRLERLVSHIKVYLANEYEPIEVAQSLKEPGSLYYHVEDGFRQDLLTKDMHRVHKSQFASQFNIDKKIDSVISLINAIEVNNIKDRLSDLDVFIDNILQSNPQIRPKSAGEYVLKGTYKGVTHMYIDEDGTYNKDLLKSDLNHIDGNNDFTTFRGYFIDRQLAYLSANSFPSDIAEDVSVYATDDTSTDLVEDTLDDTSTDPDEEISTSVSDDERSASLAEVFSTLATTAFKPRAIKPLEVVAQEQQPIEKPLQEVVEPKELQEVADTVVVDNKIIVDNESSPYDALYKLAVQCAQLDMDYNDFYDAVFKPDGMYFQDNPFVTNDELQKADVVKALIPNNFKSPKSFYDSAYKDVNAKTQNEVELTRVSGVIPRFVDESVNLGTQFNLIDTLVNNGSPTPIDTAEQVIKQSFRSWYENSQGVVGLHPIFAENLLTITPETLVNKYNEDAIKLFADVTCIAIKKEDTAIEIAEKLIQQWKATVELADITSEVFIELPVDIQKSMASNIGVPYSPSSKDLANHIYAKIKTNKELTDLRIAQYGYIKSAITVENEKGTLPSFVYRQLANLLANELQYTSLVEDKLQRTLKANLLNAVNTEQQYLLSTDNSTRLSADLLSVPKDLVVKGVQKSDNLQIDEFKYMVSQESNDGVDLQPQVRAHAFYGDGLMVSSDPLSFEYMTANNIQPVNRKAIIASLSAAKDLFDNTGYISFVTEKGLFGVIHKDKSKYALRVTNSQTGKSDSYKSNDIDDSLSMALDFFPLTSMEFVDGFSEEFAHRLTYSGLPNTKSLEQVYQTLINTSNDEAAFSAIAKDVALDVVAKANELAVEVQGGESDPVLAAVSLIDQLRDKAKQSVYSSIIGVNSELLNNELKLIEHIESLSSSEVFVDIQEQQITEDMQSLLVDLDSSALRDLNSTSAIEPLSTSLEDLVLSEKASPLSSNPLTEQDEDILRAIDELDEGNNSTFSNTSLTAQDEDILRAIDELDELSKRSNSVDNEESKPEEIKVDEIQSNESEVNNDDIANTVDLANSLLNFSTQTSFIDDSLALSTDNIVVYQTGDNIKFGYLREGEKGQFIEKYVFQDEEAKLLDSNPSLFIGENNEKQAIYAISKNEYADIVNKAGKTFNDRIDRAISRLDRVSSSSVKDIKLLASIVGIDENTIHNSSTLEVVELINAHVKINQLAQSPTALVTEEEKVFVQDYFGEKDAFTKLPELALQSQINANKKMIAMAYEEGLSDAKASGIAPNVINHVNNTGESLDVNNIKFIHHVDKDDFISAISKPAPLYDILSKLSNDNDIVQMSAKLLVDINDLEKITSLQSTDAFFESTVSAGIWDQSGIDSKELAIKLDLIEKEDPKLITPANTQAYFVVEDKLVCAYTEVDVYETDQSVWLYDEAQDGEKTNYETNIADVCFYTDEVRNESADLIKVFYQSANNLKIDVDSDLYLATPLEDASVIDRFATVHAAQQLHLQMTKISNQAKIPKGYDLRLTNNKYSIQSFDELNTKKQYDEIGFFATIEELNKAILVAKRDINGVNNDKTNALRSDVTKSPQEPLPRAVKTTTQGPDTGELHPQQTKRDELLNVEANQAINNRSEIESELHREHDNDRGSKPASTSDSKTSNISSNGIKLNPNIDFSYSEDDIKQITAYKTITEAYEINMAAIRLAKEISSQDRVSTIEEKSILAQYRGWGGLAEILDNGYMSHGHRRKELKEIVSVDEYDSIKSSTLSAYYTSPLVSNQVWQGLKHMGCQGGFGIDPAFGVGNFASSMPEEFADKVTLQGKEIDHLTSEIARHIHGPLVKNQGYEAAKIPADTFDFAISNIPFGDFKVYDKSHRDMSMHLIHDYFILKSIDKVKPGGFVAFITSSGTLDKGSSSVREKISGQADLVGAIRLPTDVFSENARTQVNSDILFFQKRLPNTEPSNTNWIESTENNIPYRSPSTATEQIKYNQYFVDNPDMIIGNKSVVSTRFGKSYKTEFKGDLSVALNEAIQRLPKDIHFEYTPLKTDKKPEALSELTSGRRLGSYQLDSDGDVAIVIEKFVYNEETDESDSIQMLEKYELGIKMIPKMKGLIKIRDTAQSHIYLMLTSRDKNVFSDSLDKLNKSYDDFTSEYGAVNAQGNRNLFRADPDSALVLGLEMWDKKTKKALKADVFKERTIYPTKEITHVDDIEDAVIISLGEKGEVDPDYISELTDKPWANIVAELGNKLYLNPQNNEWEHSSTYLAGHVRDKLVLAKEAAVSDDIFTQNVENLEKVIPVDIPYYEIRAKLGSSWIPESDVRDFVKYVITGETEPCNVIEKNRYYQVKKFKGFWELDVNSYKVNINSGRTSSEFGTQQWPADKLLAKILNNKSIVVNGTTADGVKYIKSEETAEANAKADLIKETFKQWLWEDKPRTTRLEASYNQKVNGFVEPVFDGSKINIQGLSTKLKGKEFKPREKQLNAIMRYLVSGRALYLHDVGVGKSFALLGAIIKGKQVGKHTKPMLTVPNNVFPQMQDLALGHFPNAKILMVDAKLLNKESRESTLAKIATNNWDIVIIPHSIVERIDVPDEFKKSLLEQELSEVTAAIDSLGDNSFKTSRSIKAYQAKLKNAKTKIQERLDNKDSYNTVNMAEMGVDALFIDEADEFVNLGKVTNMGHVAGVNIKEAKKARAIYYLTQYLHHVNGGEGIVLATGTDIRNNIADQFALLRYLAPDILMEQDIEMYDDFIGTFGEIETKFEIAPEGSGFIEKTRLSKFYNLPELSMLYRQVADVVNAEDANIVRPNIEQIQILSHIENFLPEYMEVLAHRAKELRGGGNKDDNMLAISGNGRKAAIDMRFIDANIPDDPNSKTNLCVKQVLHEYHANKELNPSQIIFSDIGVPNKDGRFDLYNDIKQKLVLGGIDEEKIVFARDFKSDANKQLLQDKMNSGEIAVAIGSTENMGVGKNVQERLVCIHDLSIPWRVRDLEQRGGRIERFGNLFEDASRYKYTTKDSFDIFIWQKLKQKALFAAQTKLTPRDAAREFDEDIDLSYSEIMSAATGNPLIQESIELESEVDRLGILQRSHHRAKATRNSDIVHTQSSISRLNESLVEAKLKNKIFDNVAINVLGKPIGKTENASKIINKSINDAKKKKTGQTVFEIGDISGNAVSVKTAGNTKKLALVMDYKDEEHVVALGHNVATLLENLSNIENEVKKDFNYYTSQIKFYESKLESLTSINDDKFPHADKLIGIKQRLKDVQREIAVQVEGQEKQEVKDPMQNWDNLLASLNSKQLLDDLKADKDLVKKDGEDEDEDNDPDEGMNL